MDGGHVESHRDAGIPAAVRLAVDELPPLQNTLIDRRFLHFHIDIDLRLPFHRLPAGQDAVGEAHGPVSGGKQDRPAPFLEVDLIDRALVRNRIRSVDSTVFQVHIKAIRRQVLVVITDRDNR